MANAIEVQVIGVKELQAKLSLLPKKIANKVLRQALRTAGKIVLDETKTRAPVLTGALKRGIKLRAMRRSRTGVGVRVMTPTREELSIPADSKWYYPAILEYGTKKKAAHSYMRPAFEAKKEQATNLAKKLVVEGVDREVAALNTRVTQ